MEELKIWAKKVIDTITPFAEHENVNKDFYPLQSPIKTDVEVLFIGLNPGGGYTYTKQKENPRWGFENGRMTANKLLQGNPEFENAFNNWPLFRGLKQIPSINNVLNNDNYLFANYYYLSTESFDQALNDPFQSKAIEKCKELTLELIRLVKPKIIIVLGTLNGIDKLPFSYKKTVLDGIKKRLLMSATFEGIRVFAIPHPSTLAISEDEINALSTNLIELIEDRDLTYFHFERNSIEKFSSDKFLNEISLSNLNLEFTSDKKSNLQFQGIFKHDEDSLLIKIVVKSNEQYLGVRDANAPNSGTPDRFYINLKKSDFYCSKITDPKTLKQGGWLIKKDFKMYELTTIEDLYKAILNDIANITRA